MGPVSQRVQQLEDQQQATLKEIKMAIEQSPRVRKVDTRRAVRAISAEGLCRPKFEVGDVLGSFRLSRGCGMVSRFPLYSFESPVIDGRFWESNRFFLGELAICMVTLYLWPMHLWPLADTWRTVR